MVTETFKTNRDIDAIFKDDDFMKNHGGHKSKVIKNAIVRYYANTKQQLKETPAADMASKPIPELKNMKVTAS